MIAPVLHKLWWKLNSIPFYAPNSRNQAFVLSGEHVLKCMTEFMEHSLNLEQKSKDNSLISISKAQPTITYQNNET